MFRKAGGFGAVLLLLLGSPVRAQNRVDLEDMTIKGELTNENRLQLFSRDPYQQAERATYRENFRREIIDHLETRWPASVNEPSSPPEKPTPGGAP